MLWNDVVIIVCALIGLSVMSAENWLLFHSVSEIFAIVVAFSVAIGVGNTYKIYKNAFFPFLAVGTATMAIFDTVHLLAIKGMIVFASFDGLNLAPQMWVIARLLESTAMLLAVMCINRQVKMLKIVLGYVVLAAVLLLAVFDWQIFPTAFVQGEGITSFQIYTEYVVCLIFLASIIGLVRFRKNFHPQVFGWLLVFFIATILTEICFSLYTSLTGTANIVGHLFKFIAFYGLYKAVIKVALCEPYKAVFFQVSQENQELWQQMEASNERLRQEIVEHRNTEQALEVAKRDAEQASHAKSRFMAKMSHELRTPMNGIMGLTQLLQRSELSAMQQEYLDGIGYSAQSLMNIISDILDYSKLAAGQLVLQEQDFDFRSIAVDISEAFRVIVEGNGVDLRLAVASDLPLLRGDSYRCQQILLNLMSNAEKFTQQGYIELKIEHKLHDEQTALVSVTISDSGCGISENKLTTIFDDFNQADNSATRVYGGTGLGLTIVRKLAELMGGSVKVTSREMIGSSFIVELPLKIAHNTVISAQTIPTSTTINLDEMVGALHLLIVEDEKINAWVLREICEKAGYDTTLAEDGREAVDLFSHLRPAAVFMDIHLPEMDGLTAIQRIRDFERSLGMHTPIIVVTADAFPEDKERALLAGADYFIPKPFEAEKIVQLLEDLFQK